MIFRPLTNLNVVKGFFYLKSQEKVFDKHKIVLKMGEL